MKLAYFDDYRLGVVTGEGIVDVGAELHELPRRAPEDLMAALIEHFAEYRARVENAAINGRRIALADVRFRPPLPRPHSIVCMAVNYDDGLLKSTHTNAFHKSPSALIGHDETMVLPDVPASVFEGEAEMAVVIGRKASNVDAEHAMNYVFGYMNFIDGSARGLPPAGNTFYQTKSRDTFAPIGPYLVTADEVPDPQNLRVRLWVNGAPKQDFSTSAMAHKIPRCIEWVSAIHTLEPGDILATGTHHHGLSSFQDGDVVELETEGLGRLRIGVRDELKRTWSRDTRLQHREKGLPGVSTPQLTGKYTKAET
jgi:2-keto-4-pentenoate hydratase/2-oxohepta-3-ene-1,7-dioic acid hydratase in catechol pathway